MLLVAIATSGVAVAPARAAPAHDLLALRALAAPVCPVETIPPDPRCAPRPVVGAVVLVDPVSRPGPVLRLVTDRTGRASMRLRPGRYRVIPRRVRGLLGTPAPVSVVLAGRGRTVRVALDYDTGIR